MMKECACSQVVCVCVCRGHVEERRAGGAVGVGDGISVPH